MKSFFCGLIIASLILLSGCGRTVPLSGNSEITPGDRLEVTGVVIDLQYEFVNKTPTHLFIRIQEEGYEYQCFFDSLLDGEFRHVATADIGILTINGQIKSFKDRNIVLYDSIILY